MADPASHQDAAAADPRTQSERTMDHLEWLGSHLHPLEQSVLLNNMEKFMKDSDNMVARIKSGERPADVFASVGDATSMGSGAPPTNNSSSTRRRRLSSGQSRALNGSASASSPSSETARRGLLSEEQNLARAPANPRKRHAEQD